MYWNVHPDTLWQALIGFKVFGVLVFLHIIVPYGPIDVFCIGVFHLGIGMFSKKIHRGPTICSFVGLFFLFELIVLFVVLILFMQNFVMIVLFLLMFIVLAHVYTFVFFTLVFHYILFIMAYSQKSWRWEIQIVGKVNKVVLQHERSQVYYVASSKQLWCCWN